MALAIAPTAASAAVLDVAVSPQGGTDFGESHTITGKLTGPTGNDFDLYLQKWNGSSWAVVGRGETSTSTENVSYSGTSGSYRWRVYSYSGSGSFSLCTTKP